MSRKKTTEQFIEEARKIHGDLYGYDLVDYKTAKTKVFINCKVHGVFEQTPDGHLSGRCCFKCADLRKGDYNRLTTKEFINRSISIHGDKYDYRLVSYKSSHHRVKIICDIHGEFEQSPTNHLSGRGCNKCGCLEAGNKTRKTTCDFIEKANIIHNNKYDYSLIDYKSGLKKIAIVCKKHGKWYQTPKNHLNEKGCPKCSGRGKTTHDIIKQFNNVHGDRYDYSLVNYIDTSTKVSIICKKHGVFKQIPSGHLNKKGCAKCAIDLTSKNSRENPVGWSSSNWEKSALKSKNFDSFKVYILRCWNDNEEFYKIGRTFNTIKQRFQSKCEMPYNHEVVDEIIFDNAKDCFNKESELKRINRKSKYLPLIHFDGKYECFKNKPVYV